jgi:putative phosphoesterase
VREVFAGCDHIFHAGDVGAASILDELEAIAPVTAVLGNCDRSDYGFSLRPFVSLTLEGIRFFIIHKPFDAEEALRGRGAIAPGQPLPHVCIHGHTHIPCNEFVGSVRVLCPGSPNRPRGGSAPSVLLLDAEKGELTRIEFVELL